MNCTLDSTPFPGCFSIDGKMWNINGNIGNKMKNYLQNGRTYQNGFRERNEQLLE